MIDLPTHLENLCYSFDVFAFVLLSLRFLLRGGIIQCSCLCLFVCVYDVIIPYNYTVSIDLGANVDIRFSLPYADVSELPSSSFLSGPNAPCRTSPTARGVT